MRHCPVITVSMKYRYHISSQIIVTKDLMLTTLKINLPFLNSFFNDLDVFINGARVLVNKIKAIMISLHYEKKLYRWLVSELTLSVEKSETVV